MSKSETPEKAQPVSKAKRFFNEVKSTNLYNMLVKIGIICLFIFLGFFAPFFGVFALVFVIVFVSLENNEKSFAYLSLLLFFVVWILPIGSGSFVLPLWIIAIGFVVAFQTVRYIVLTAVVLGVIAL